MQRRKRAGPHADKSRKRKEKDRAKRNRDRRDMGPGRAMNNRPPRTTEEVRKARKARKAKAEPPPQLDCEMKLKVVRRNSEMARAERAEDEGDDGDDDEEEEEQPQEAPDDEVSGAVRSAAADRPTPGGAPGPDDFHERCVSRSEVDVLAETDVEWFWRLGFRRLLPGAAEPVRLVQRPASPLDVLLEDYFMRWPKEEDAWVPLPGPDEG